MQITPHERTWLDGLNRGDVCVADRVFASDCVIHINGSQDRNLDLAGFKQMVEGLLVAFPSAPSRRPGVRCELMVLFWTMSRTAELSNAGSSGTKWACCNSSGSREASRLARHAGKP